MRGAPPRGAAGGTDGRVSIPKAAMSERVDTSDEQLTARVRAGDHAALALLRRRHERAARALATSVLGDGAASDDAVSEAFARVLSRLLHGPDELAFRPLLLQTVGQVVESRVSARRRRDPAASPAPAVTGAGSGTSAGSGPGGSAEQIDLRERCDPSPLAHPYVELDVADQTALWHADVDVEPVREVADVLGIRPNEVPARLEESRDRLRRAYVRRHLRDETDVRCRSVAARLPDYLAGRLAHSAEDDIGDHLDECDRCHTLHVELADVGRGLRLVLVPAIVGLGVVIALALGGTFGTGDDLETPSTVRVEMADPSIPVTRPTVPVSTATSAAPVAPAPPSTGGPASPSPGEPGSSPASTVDVPVDGGHPPAEGDGSGGGGYEQVPPVTPPAPSTTTDEPGPSPSGADGAWVDPDLLVADQQPAGTTTTVPSTTSTTVLSGPLAPYELRVDAGAGLRGGTYSPLDFTLEGSFSPSQHVRLTFSLPSGSRFALRPSTKCARDGASLTCQWSAPPAGSSLADGFSVLVPSGTSEVVLEVRLEAGSGGTRTTTFTLPVR